MKKLMKKIAVVLCTILAINSVVAGSTIPAKADTGEGQPKGVLNFVCQSNAIIGGHIAYKINGATEFSHPSENSEEHVYESLDLNGIESLNSFTIKFETSHGYQLDTTRGVNLWVNGEKRYSEAGDNIAGFIGDNGYTFNLSAILKSGETVSNSNFELEFGFETQNGGGQNGGGDPHGPEPGMLSFLCQDLEEAAQVMFRFGTDESKEFFTVDNRLVSIPEGESSVTIKFILNDPKVYMLDTGRGVSLRVNGDEKYHLSGQSAEGVMEYTFNLAELAGDKAINQSSFELSYGFQYSDPSMDKRPQNMLWVFCRSTG